MRIGREEVEEENPDLGKTVAIEVQTAELPEVEKDRAIRWFLVFGKDLDREPKRYFPLRERTK